MTTAETELIEDFFDEDLPEEAAEDRRRRYSIADRAGADLQAQIGKADWHLRKLAEINYRERLLTDPIIQEIQRLEARLKAVQARFAQERGFHEGVLVEWTLDCNLRELLGKTIPFPHGQIKTTQTRGKTEVAEDAVLRLYYANPKDYGDLVKQKVDPSAVRDRYDLRDDGACIDRESGEVLTGDAAVIIRTEEPTIKVTVIASGPGQDLAEDGE